MAVEDRSPASERLAPASPALLRRSDTEEGAVLARVGAGAGAAAGVEEGFASLARVSRRSSRLAGLSLPLARPCSPGGGGLYESGALRSRLGRLEPAKSCAWSAAMSLRVAGSMSASGPTAEVGSAEGVPRVERPMARAELLHKAPRGRRERAKTSGGSRRAGPSRGARVGRSATIEVQDDADQKVAAKPVSPPGSPASRPPIVTAACRIRVITRRREKEHKSPRPRRFSRHTRVLLL